MTGSNKKVAKNAIYLYIRMFITMIISLYTSRVILQILGETDFGIYNIVGGIVILFSFLNAALTTATQRYLSFELGKKDLDALKKIFSISVTCFLVLSLLIVVLSETLGVWFLNTYLNIPDDRMFAANWVFQFSVFAFIMQMIRVPYNASIIAHERMNFYALVSIVESCLKLGIVYILLIFVADKLILYSILMALIMTIMTFIYKIYCNYYFRETKYKYYWEKSSVKDFLSFSGWSVLGGVANIGSHQAINFMLNIFFGVITNAAIGIANQVTGAIYSFVSNFQSAFNPQIVKAFAANEQIRFQRLVLIASKLSFFLLYAIGLPIMLNLNFILELWLGEIPKYTLEFIQIIFLYQVIDAVSMPLLTCIQAGGNIKRYQIMISILILFNIPLAFGAMKLGYDPYIVWVSKIIVNLMCFTYRCIYVQNKFNLKFYPFFRGIMLPALFTVCITYPTGVYIQRCIDEPWSRFVSSSILSIGLVILCAFFIGLTRNERGRLKQIYIDKKQDK